MVQERKMSFEGGVEYHWDEAKDYEWVEVGERSLLDMLRRMGYQYDTIGEHAKLKVTIQILELGDEFV